MSAIVCYNCKPWCATSHRQLNNRKRNFRPGDKLYPCPECKSTDWAMTDIFVEGETPSLHSGLPGWVWMLCFALWGVAAAVAIWMCTR